MEQVECDAVLKKIMDDGTFDELRHKVVERLKDDVRLPQNIIKMSWASISIS